MLCHETHQGLSIRITLVAQSLCGHLGSVLSLLPCSELGEHVVLGIKPGLLHAQHVLSHPPRGPLEAEHRHTLCDPAAQFLAHPGHRQAQLLATAAASSPGCFGLMAPDPGIMAGFAHWAVEQMPRGRTGSLSLGGGPAYSPWPHCGFLNASSH